MKKGKERSAGYSTLSMMYSNVLVFASSYAVSYGAKHLNY